MFWCVVSLYIFTHCLYFDSPYELVKIQHKMCHNTLYKFCSIICQVVAYRRLKIEESFKLLALKVVVVAYKRWSLTRGGHLQEVPNIVI